MFANKLSFQRCWALAGVICFGFLTSCCHHNNRSEQKNLKGIADSVVFVSLDTLRADHVGVYGATNPTTPNIDEIAKKGIVFDRAYAQASWTQPSHRAMFYSQLVPSRSTEGSVPLAEALQSCGLKTGAVTGGGHVSARFGFDRGFESFREIKKGGIAAEFPLVEDWLRGESDNKVFFFFHTYEIHPPFDPPPPFSKMFFPQYSGHLTGAGIFPYYKEIAKRRSKHPDLDLRDLAHMDDDDCKQYESLYDGGIRYSDTFIGKLVTVMKETQLWNRAVLVIFSDHGEEFWDHGSVGHGHTLYNELLRVPLILHLPGDRLAGTRVHQTIPLSDLSPTLVELVGGEPPASFLGKSLLPALRGQDSRFRTAYATSQGWSSIISYPFKYVEDGKGDKMLFDLSKDPRETISIIQENQELAATLKKKLREVIRMKSSTDSTEEKIDDIELREQLSALGYVVN